MASSADAIGSIDLSGIAALQDVSTNVTFRVVNYGGGSRGTWYIYKTVLSLQGVVAQVPSPPVLVPVASATAGFQFSLNGAVGSVYVIEASDSLNASSWVPIATNEAPFIFTDTDLSRPGRFYRAVLLP